jgi:hypothetical protein
MGIELMIKDDTVGMKKDIDNPFTLNIPKNATLIDKKYVPNSPHLSIIICRIEREPAE